VKDFSTDRGYLMIDQWAPTDIREFRTSWAINPRTGARRMAMLKLDQKSPTLTADLRAMVDRTGDGIIGARDRALILLGFGGAFRRSELVALDVVVPSARTG
jgi:hypothetical protein